jgi:hypothetical protein
VDLVLDKSWVYSTYLADILWTQRFHNPLLLLEKSFHLPSCLIARMRGKNSIGTSQVLENVYVSAKLDPGSRESNHARSKCGTLEHRCDSLNSSQNTFKETGAETLEAFTSLDSFRALVFIDDYISNQWCLNKFFFSKKRQYL